MEAVTGVPEEKRALISSYCGLFDGCGRAGVGAGAAGAGVRAGAGDGAGDGADDGAGVGFWDGFLGLLGGLA